MKRFFALCGILILSLFAVGCTKTIELSDEESKLIAEYAAELLIKYDRNINLKYDEAQQEAVIDADATEEEISTEEITTEEPASEEVTTEEATTEEVEMATDTDAPSEEIITEDVDEEVLASDYDIAQFVGESEIAIHYLYYMIVDHYP